MYNNSFNIGIRGTNNINTGKPGYFPIIGAIGANNITCTECNSTEHVKLFQISPEPDTTITILMCSSCRMLV